MVGDQIQEIKAQAYKLDVDTFNPSWVLYVSWWIKSDKHDP